GGPAGRSASGGPRPPSRRPLGGHPRQASDRERPRTAGGGTGFCPKGRRRAGRSGSLGNRHRASPKRPTHGSNRQDQRRGSGPVQVTTIHGEHIVLRPIQEADYPLLAKWGQDPELGRLLEGDYPRSLDDCPAWQRKVISSRHRQLWGLQLAAGGVIG